MNELCIREVSNATDLAHAFKLRELVFIEEQGIAREIEFDGLDDRCRHLLAMIGDRPVGTLRIRETGERSAKIERVVVLKSERGRQIGARMMQAALERTRDLGLDTVKIHAQTYAEPFYAKLGFVAYGDEFDEDGIPHIAMHADLPEPSTDKTES